MVIVNRADIAPGDFDLEFNYNGVSWDSGQASGGGGDCQGGASAAVGYTNGSTNAFELAGSFENGALLDGGSHALSSGSQNSSVPGRYIFPIRAGGEGSSVTGTVKDNGGASPVGGALVSICSTGGGATACYLGNTGTDGAYSILGVPNGTYAASVSPPRGSSDNEFKSSAFSVTGATTEDFVLTRPDAAAQRDHDRRLRADRNRRSLRARHQLVRGKPDHDPCLHGRDSDRHGHRGRPDHGAGDAHREPLWFGHVQRETPRRVPAPWQRQRRDQSDELPGSVAERNVRILDLRRSERHGGRRQPRQYTCRRRDGDAALFRQSHRHVHGGRRRLACDVAG